MDIDSGSSIDRSARGIRREHDLSLPDDTLEGWL